MKTKHFDNIRGYDENGVTRIIPDAARKSCRQAWLFARERGLPMNQHVQIRLPDHISPEGLKKAYRWYAQKSRMYARTKKFKAVFALVRSCDPERNLNPRIDILMHVPSEHHDHFKKIVENWLHHPEVCSVDYNEITGPDGIIRSAFNDLFSATSTQFGLNHPELPRRASGEVIGHRTFYSRHLWTKKQIEIRRKKQAPF